jgi:hypothetical protein
MDDFVTFSVRIPANTYQHLRERATANYRTLTQEVAYRLSRSLEQSALADEGLPDSTNGGSGGQREQAPRTTQLAA